MKRYLRYCWTCPTVVSPGARYCRDCWRPARRAARIQRADRRDAIARQPITIVYLEPIPGIEWDRLPGMEGL